MMLHFAAFLIIFRYVLFLLAIVLGMDYIEVSRSTKALHFSQYADGCHVRRIIFKLSLNVKKFLFNRGLRADSTVLLKHFNVT